MNPIFWPLLVFGVVHLVALCASTYEHGKESKPKNFWSTAFSAVVNCLWLLWLLSAAGVI